MKIPEKLKIGAHEFTVIIKDMDNCGVTDRTKNTITIDSGLTQSQQESTFIHELLHVINNELDHALLDSLAEQIYQVINDNNLLCSHSKIEK